jgi:hypothetical protein
MGFSEILVRAFLRACVITAHGKAFLQTSASCTQVAPRKVGQRPANLGVTEKTT